MSGAIDKQVGNDWLCFVLANKLGHTFILSSNYQELRLMLITELRDAYRNANKSSSAPDFSLQLESMKDEVGSTFN